MFKIGDKVKIVDISYQKHDMNDIMHRQARDNVTLIVKKSHKSGVRAYQECDDEVNNWFWDNRCLKKINLSDEAEEL